MIKINVLQIPTFRSGGTPRLTEAAGFDLRR